MPYIDRDKFLKSMTSKFKCVPLIGVPKTINGEECFDGEDLQQVLNQAPTEDVVPRAEFEKARQVGFELGKTDSIYGHSVEQMAEKVEELSIELEAMRGAAKSYKMHYENAKQEVAMEIFEEIEKYLQPNEDWTFEMKRQNQDCSEEYWGGKLSAFKQIRGFIDVNLKKKYIGE